MKMVCVTLMIMTLLIFGGVVSGCAVSEKNATDTDSVSVDATEQTDRMLWQRADSMMQAMNSEQRLGMMLMPSVYTRSDAATLKLISDYASDIHVGGLILLKGDTLSAKIITDRLRAAGRGDDIWIAIDAEWGLGMRLSDAPKYPYNSELGKAATEEQMYAYGQDIAAQARRLGINMILGPVADVVPEGQRSFLSRRSLGSDAERVALLSTAYSLGLEEGGVLSVAKHFPGHGGVTSDTHHSAGMVYKSLNEMQESDLVPFDAYIKAGLSGIMIGHQSFPAIDTKRLSASVSESVITDLLRCDMGFRGLILTDALNMSGAGGASAVDAVLAGADMVLSPTDTKTAKRELAAALADGRLKQEAVDDHVRRIIYYMLKINLNKR